MARTFHRRLDTCQVNTLRSSILEEIDFVLEAERTEQFARFLARSPELAGRVTVPKVYRQACSARVLTLERMYGVPFSDLESVRRYSDSPEQALITALNTWTASVLGNEWCDLGKVYLVSRRVYIVSRRSVHSLSAKCT
jgi:predicted unusual protein kinase regulating ubiquinone biosynthesis (AarF/ABC1/UbiB family)